MKPTTPKAARTKDKPRTSTILPRKLFDDGGAEVGEDEDEQEENFGTLEQNKATLRDQIKNMNRQILTFHEWLSTNTNTPKPPKDQHDKFRASAAAALGSLTQELSDATKKCINSLEANYATLMKGVPRVPGLVGLEQEASRRLQLQLQEALKLDLCTLTFNQMQARAAKREQLELARNEVASPPTPAPESTPPHLDQEYCQLHAERQVTAQVLHTLARQFDTRMQDLNDPMASISCGLQTSITEAMSALREECVVLDQADKGRLEWFKEIISVQARFVRVRQHGGPIALEGAKSKVRLMVEQFLSFEREVVKRQKAVASLQHAKCAQLAAAVLTVVGVNKWNSWREAEISKLETEMGNLCVKPNNKKKKKKSSRRGAPVPVPTAGSKEQDQDDENEHKDEDAPSPAAVLV